MERVEKTVFLSYRRTNAPWALVIYKDLTHHGYDVFFDYTGIASGDFESAIVENIKARAHFLIVLTPSALEHFDDPQDWLRREVETALETQRNIVPLMVEGFDFGAPGVSNKLTGKLASLKNYNGMGVSVEYFDAAMQKLREKYLNVSLAAVRRPASASAAQAATEQQVAANAAPPVQEKELTAQQWFERGFAATDLDEQLRSYNEAVRLQPDFAWAFNNRGYTRYAKGDVEGALQDYNEAIRLQPNNALAFNNRGLARFAKGDVEGALQDYTEAIRLQPDFAQAFLGRGYARYAAQGDVEGALQDYTEAIRLKPDDADAFSHRGNARKAKGDLEGAQLDYDEAIRLKDELKR
jgi:tetratricopeptide (TPR) repeat protein